MNYAYVAYNTRSATTGKALFEALKAANAAGLIWRHCMDKAPSKQPKVFLRWGNSLSPTPAGAMELNTREAVARASNKLEMAKILSRTEGVKMPRIIFFNENPAARLPEGNWFIRNRHDQVRYRGALQAGDKYATEEIAKTREFRVHVFNDQILGVYEKLPQNAGDKILKAENCEFKRIDLASKEQTRTISGVRPMAKAAVKALGLLYGGVDVIMDAQGNTYVLEVNSSPALNGPNIGRWVTAFTEYLKNPVAAPAPVRNQEAEVNPEIERRRREAEAESQRLQRVRERNNAWSALQQKVAQFAAEEGFEISLTKVRDNRLV